MTTPRKVGSTYPENRSDPLPRDVEAWQRLDVESPAVAVALRNAVMDLCASLAVDAAVVGMSLIGAARVFLGLAEDDQSIAYAARRAVRFARQDWQRIQATDPESMAMRMEGPDLAELRLPSFHARPDGIALESSGYALREAFGALLDRIDAREVSAGASPVVRPVWESIVEAWEAHDRRECERCSTPGPGVTLATIRGHVAGIPADSAAWKRGKRADGRVVALVTDALSVLVEPRGWEAGAVFPLIYGEAWRAVECGDSRDYSAPVPVIRSAREVSQIVRSRAVESGPMARVRYAREVSHLGYPLHLGYGMDRLGYPSHLGYGDGFRVTADAYRSRRMVSLRSSRVVSTDALDSPDPSLVREPLDSLGYVSALGYAPESGVWGARVMSEREVSALDVVREARPRQYVGEFAERGSSAPIGERDRRDDGQVLSFKPVVSPRKKAPATCALIPAQGMTR